MELTVSQHELWAPDGIKPVFPKPRAQLSLTLCAFAFVCVTEQLQLSCAIFQWKKIMPVTTTSWTTLKLCTPLTRCEMESVCVGCVSVNRNIQFSCPETEKHNRESALSLLAYRSELAFTRNQNIKIKDQSGAQVSLSGLCMCALVKLQEFWIPHQLWHTFDLGNVGPSSY